MAHILARTARTSLLLGILVLASGCASAGSRDNPFRGGGPGDDAGLAPSEAVIEVEHMGRTGADVTVYLVGSGRSRRRLGRVSMGSEQRFTITVVGASEHQLVGEIVGESDLVSRAFVLRAGRGVHWNIALNQISILQ